MEWAGIADGTRPGYELFRLLAEGLTLFLQFGQKGMEFVFGVRCHHCQRSERGRCGKLRRRRHEQHRRQLRRSYRLSCAHRAITIRIPKRGLTQRQPSAKTIWGVSLPSRAMVCKEPSSRSRGRPPRNSLKLKKAQERIPPAGPWPKPN